MKRYYRGGLRALLVTCIMLAGCDRPAREPGDVDVVLLSSQCGRQVPSEALAWIDSEIELQELYRRINQSKSGGGGVIGGPFNVSPEDIPEVDFAVDGLVLIEMGRRPTAGFGLAPLEPAFSVADGTARLSIAWQEPGPESVVAQVMTSPCLLIAVPRGDYDRIVVRDQDNQLRTSLRLR